MTTSQYMLGRKQYTRPQAMLWSNNAGTLQNGLYVPQGYEVGTDLTTLTNPLLTNEFIVLSDDNRSPIDFKIQRMEKRERMINGRMRSYHIADKLQISTSWDMLPSRAFYRNPDFKPEVTITNVVANGSKITYTGKNYFAVGDTVSVVGTNITGFNVTNAVVTDATSTSFAVASTATGSYLSGGIAFDAKTGKSPYSALDQGTMYTSDGGAGGVELLDWYENHKGPFWVFLAYDKYTNFSGEDEKYTHLNQYNEVVEMYISDFNYSVQKRAGSNYDFWNVSVSLEEV
jgi:hypothetical protein